MDSLVSEDFDELSQTDFKLSQWSERLLAVTRAGSGRPPGGTPTDLPPSTSPGAASTPSISLMQASQSSRSTAQVMQPAERILVKPCSTAQLALPTKHKQVRNMCDQGLLDYAFALGEAMPSMPSMPHWFNYRTGTNGKFQDGKVRGVVVVRGSLGDASRKVFCAELRQALAQVLAPAVGPDPQVSVAAASRPSSRTCLGAIAGEESSMQTCAEFKFEVDLADPNDRAPAVEVLRMEAVSGGARRLLPLLANAEGEAAGRLAIRLELTSE